MLKVFKAAVRSTEAFIMVPEVKPAAYLFSICMEDHIGPNDVRVLPWGVSMFPFHIHVARGMETLFIMKLSYNL